MTAPKLSPPSAIYVMVTLAIFLGIGFMQLGVGFIMTGVGESFVALALIGVALLSVGVIDILAGVGFFYPRRWTWMLGIVASILTGLLGLVEVNVQMQSLSITIGVDALRIAWIFFPSVILSYLTRAGARVYFSIAR